MNNTSVDLREKYPKIFKDIHWANYGFPKTWTDLVDNLCKELQEYCDEHDCQVQCTQVKEKFGTLQFYIEPSSQEIYDIIRRAEKKSRTICQECGCTDCEILRTTKGWITYLCKSCVNRLGKSVD